MTTMAVTLTADVQWINECYGYDSGAHEHVSVYVVRAGDEYVVIDSGSFYHREAIERGVDAATGGRGIDAIVLSHSDYPHSANVRPLQSRWGDVELVASSGAPEQQGLPEARKATIGGSMDVCGREFSFIDPPLADRSHTTWIYEHDAGVLFTADGFGNYHQPGECDATSRDLDGGIDYEAIRRHNRETLVWLRYVAPEKLEAKLEAIFAEYDPNWVAPIHGNPIAAADLDDYLDKLVGAASEIADGYAVPEA